MIIDPIRAWRYHIAWPSSLDELRYMLRNPGREPVDPLPRGRHNRPRHISTWLTETLGQIRDHLFDQVRTPRSRRRDANLSDLADIDAVPGLPAHIKTTLHQHGYVSVGDVRRAQRFRLATLPGVRAPFMDELSDLASTAELPDQVPARAKRALRRAGYASIGALRRATRAELARIEGVGTTTLDLLKPSPLESAKFPFRDEASRS